MKLLRLILILCLCCGLGACHSTRKATTAQGRAAGWHSLEVPVKVVLSKPMTLSSSGKATLVCDSSVYLSLRMLGMEIAYLSANADSALVCDRYHKIYLEEALNDVLPAKYASIGSIQLLMLGAELPDALKDRINRYEPVETPLGQLYSVIEFDSILQGKPLKVALEYNYDKAVWDNPGLRVPTPKLPRNARRVSAESILKTLSTEE